MDDDSADRSARIERLRSRSAGTLESDPYEDVDVSQLPEWWQKAIEEFEEHGLRAFRPSRFADGELKYEVVEAVKDELGVEITFKGVNVEHGDDWTVYVDGEAVGGIGRHRSPDGYTVFEMASDQFSSWIQTEIADGDG